MKICVDRKTVYHLKHLRSVRQETNSNYALLQYRLILEFSGDVSPIVTQWQTLASQCWNDLAHLITETSKRTSMDGYAIKEFVGESEE